MSLRVFVIDDSKTMRHILSRVIEQSRYCELVGAAVDVGSAYDPIAELRPDIVTLDLSLPDGDGIDHLDELRARGCPAIVVVSASTRLGSAETLRALAHGADACFDKGRIVADADLFLRVLSMTVQRTRNSMAMRTENRLRA